MLVWGIAQLLTRWRHRRIVLRTAVAALMGMFMMISYIQIGYWRDGTRLFENALAVTTNNYLAANNLGNIYFRKGRLDEAIDHYRLAIRFEPRYAIAHSNLGAALVRKGRLQDAVVQFNTALRIDPTLTDARENLGNVLAAISGKNKGDGK
jgi:tetratricopeptide (TPR) repeat protein